MSHLNDLQPVTQVPSVSREEHEKMVHQVQTAEVLSAEEHQYAQRERSVEASKQYRFANQDEVSKVRLGKILHMNEILRKLRTINPTFNFNEYGGLGRIGINVQTRQGLEFAGTIQWGYSPEYSTLRVDERGVGTNELYHGWRGGFLLGAIQKKIITEEQAHKAFGEPTSGGDSGEYRRQLQILRKLQ